MKVEINLNEKIKVKINDRGYKYMIHEHNTLMKNHPTMHWTMEILKAREDKNGYTEMQFWEFIQTFGPVTSIGFLIHYDPNIIIEYTF